MILLTQGVDPKVVDSEEVRCKGTDHPCHGLAFPANAERLSYIVVTHEVDATYLKRRGLIIETQGYSKTIEGKSGQAAAQSSLGTCFRPFTSRAPG